MQKKFLLILLLPLLVSGCGKKNTVSPHSSQAQNYAIPVAQEETEVKKPAIQYLQDEKFDLKIDSQEAVFYVKTGLTGGPGSTAVIDAKTGELKILEGKALYIPSEIASHIAQGLKQYSCIKGNPMIRIGGKIELKEKTEENDSVPGGSKTVYYEVHFLELQSLDIKATPC